MSGMFVDADPQERQYNFSLALNQATPTAFVTFGLIGLNLLMFIVMFFFGVSPIEPTPKEVLPWGANLGPLTTSGEWWRLFSACFLHFGVIHLGMNMFILFQVGIFTEKLFGSLRFLVLYLIAGVFGNIAGLYAHPQVVSAGASGAAFGVYGGLLGFLLIERGVVPVESALGIAKSSGIFLLVNLVYGLASPQTDLVAHIAGLLAGFVAVCVLARSLAPAGEHSHPLRALAVVVGAMLIGIAALSGVTRTGRSEGDWDRLIAQNPSVSRSAPTIKLFIEGQPPRRMRRTLRRRCKRSVSCSGQVFWWS
jgi:rhomboid protease GluP